MGIQMKIVYITYYDISNFVNSLIGLSIQQSIVKATGSSVRNSVQNSIWDIVDTFVMPIENKLKQYDFGR